MSVLPPRFALGSNLKSCLGQHFDVHFTAIFRVRAALLYNLVTRKCERRARRKNKLEKGRFSGSSRFGEKIGIDSRE